LIAGAVLSALIPLVAFALLTVMARLDRVDRAAVAAHYGSISIVTFVAGSEALRWWAEFRGVSGRSGGGHGNAGDPDGLVPGSFRPPTAEGQRKATCE
jgi:hypothetical protein